MNWSEIFQQVNRENLVMNVFLQIQLNNKQVGFFSEDRYAQHKRSLVPTFVSTNSMHTILLGLGYISHV